MKLHYSFLPSLYTCQQVVNPYSSYVTFIGVFAGLE